MRCTEFVKLAVFIALILASATTQAGPGGSGRGAKLSAALDGTLDSDLGEAGALAHEIDYTSIRLHSGRGVEYRQRVASEMRAHKGDRPL